MVDLAKRFWSKVDRSGGERACWPWCARRLKSGYGSFFLSKKTKPGTTTSNRMALILSGVKLTRRQYACHECCNPAHLFPGTAKQNQEDSFNKGRRPIGENHPGAVITDRQCVTIRKRRSRGIKLRVLAADYGVRESTISRICNFVKRKLPANKITIQ
jgi:hypothetical protein